MLAPQLPALTCSAALAVVLLLADAAVWAVVPSPAAWHFLLAQTMTGGLFYAGFVLFSPFAIVREIVTETLNDMLPARAQQFVTWRPKPMSRSN